MKKILFALALLLTIGAIEASAQSNPPLSNKRIRMKGQAAAPTPDPPTGYYNIWVDSGSGNLYITNSAGTDTPVGAGISGLTDNVIPQANGTTAIENSKMTASGTNSGTWTLYDNTGGTGVSQLFVRSGASQSGTPQLRLGMTGANAGFGIFVDDAVNSVLFKTGDGGQYSNIVFNSARGVGDAYYLADTGSAGWLRFSDDSVIEWTSSNGFNGTVDVALARAAAGILAVTDGSTGQGGIGLSDAATNTVSDALILRHATSGTAAASFGTGLLFQGEDAAGNMQSMASVQAVYTDATNGSEDTSFVLTNFRGGASGTLATIVGDAGVTTITTPAGLVLTSGGNINFSMAGSVLYMTNAYLHAASGNAYDLGLDGYAFKSAYVSTSIQGTRSKTLTDNAAAATFVTIAVPTSNTTVGGRIFYTITAIDAGTAIQTKTGTYSFGLNNIGGTVTGAGTDVLEHSQLSTGTLAPTFSVNISGTNAQFQLVLDTSLDAAAETLKIEYRVQIDSGTATVTPAT